MRLQTHASIGSRRAQSPIWAITSYFDPTGTRMRLQNFRTFRSLMQVPLVAVELSFNGHFDLSPGDADIIVQVQGGSILWQKERLLNLALQSLPDCCDTVAWLDSDIVLMRPDWSEAARELLSEFALVQLFERLFYLPRGFDPVQSAQIHSKEFFHSIGFHIARNTLPADSFRVVGSSQRYRYNPGMAWMARRDLLAQHGFYDAFILGAGDRALVSAACGRHSDCSYAMKLGPAATAHYHRWSASFYRATEGSIAYLGGDLLHLWHGDLSKRGYMTRDDEFSRFHFDPTADIALTREGVWTWSSDKPDMHTFVRRHFERLEEHEIPSSEPSAFQNIEV